MEIIDKKSQIWVYGYNNVGRNAYNLLKEIYGDQVQGIIETRKKHLSTISVSDAVVQDDDIVFICSNPKYHSKIKSQLAYGQKYIYTKELDTILIEMLGKKPLLVCRFLAISVGQACSLKCKDCANLSPYTKKQNLRYDIEKIKEDISKTLIHFSHIDVLHIQGGEPFVYSQLVELIDYLTTNFNHVFKKIQIATNGNTIPDTAVLDYIAKHKDVVEIRISKYPNIDTSRLVNTLAKRNIKYRIYNFANSTGEWTSCGGIDYIDKNTNPNYQTQKVFDCPWCCCFIIENGRIGRCARSIPAITLQNVPTNNGDYIELGESGPADFREYFMFIKPMECCKRCAGGYGKKIEPAIQLQ